MKKNAKSASSAAISYHIVRIFEGDRTADQVVADLVKVHNAAA